VSAIKYYYLFDLILLYVKILELAYFYPRICPPLLQQPQDEMTSHGFRATASSILNESGLWNPDAIEAQLAHVEGNTVRRAYARAEFWEERVKMMSYWADRLDSSPFRSWGERV
jgi:integrase